MRAEGKDWLLLASLIAALVFLLYPHLDLFITDRFFVDGTFIYRSHPVSKAIYIGVRVIARIFIIGLVLWALWKCLRPRLRYSWRSWFFLVLVVLAGPVFSIEYLAKGYTYRPRPVEITRYGGQFEYVAPLRLGQQGIGRSFVSNHAAVGFYIAAFAYLAARRRRFIYSAGIVLGFFIGMARVAQGSHYLSDVVFSGLIMLWTIHGAAWIIRRYFPPAKE